MTGQQQHIGINRDHWNAQAEDWVAEGERLWACSQPEWGIWGLPDSQLCLLPREMSGLRAVELGCGTGYVSGWMTRRGAGVTGIDLSREQLATARRLAAENGASVIFVEGNAEALPFEDAAFDFAISEYGAAIWCDPDIWLREAWRVLRPGGRLVFLGHHPFTILCTPESGADCDRGLHRPYRDLGRIDWTSVEIDPGGVEFNRSLAGWMALFRDIGFVVRDYQELYAPDSVRNGRFGVPVDWAKAFPAEQVWVLDKPE